MRLIIYPHELSLGGSQINAIDLAAGVAQTGHEVIVYGSPGPLNEYIEKKGLEFVRAAKFRYRPGPPRIAQLARLARRESVDLIHAYEWPPCLDAYFGAGLILGVPILCTVLSMSVMHYVPRSVPLVMGTQDLGRQASRVQTGKVWVMEPPIDVASDSPDVDGTAFRRRMGVGDDELLIVSVSRLALDLKLDALVRAIDAVDILAGRYPLRLAIVGDGPAREALSKRAEAVNSRWNRQVILLPGAMLDPRPAYAAGDIVVGMGSSALRALSIGRSVVVQGERGFSRVFEPSSLAMFLDQGFYGIGTDDLDSSHLAAQLDRLLSNAKLRLELGRYGREIVVNRFSLQRAVERHLGLYEQVLAEPQPRNLRDAIRSAANALALEIRYHDPRRKRSVARREAELLASAGSGLWPPCAQHSSGRI